MTSTVERRAIITGASSGIGKETALAFAKAGISVALVSRSRNNLE
ncbi:MAG: SDR family NAD(P)-dependent oxidoreductase, partial [Moorea sp. SIO3I7]|nr:SDR family NAD(P)-dependent oxidoreductase [Moorena sp. SIO3I7]